jgi:hypothetical protein
MPLLQAACAGSYGASGREDDKIASAVVGLWVAGRRSGRGRCRAVTGPAFVPLAAGAVAIEAIGGLALGSTGG